MCDTLLPATTEHFRVDRSVKAGLKRKCVTCERAYANHKRHGTPLACAWTPTGMKWCSRCGEAKPADSGHFTTNATSNDGLQYWCKPCRAEHASAGWFKDANASRAASRERYRANHEAELRWRQAWRDRHPERSRASTLRYYRSGKGQRTSQARYRRNRATILAKTRAWALAHPEKRREIGRSYWQRHPDKARENKLRRRAREYGAEGSHTPAEFRAKVERYAGRCHWCGKRIRGTPHADHLIALVEGGTDDIGNIVPSCGPCNQSKNRRMPWEFMPGRLL
jgi:hypothetical protein